jgi:hypothetical protein
MWGARLPDGLDERRTLPGVSLMEFTARMVTALAWPAVVLVALLLFRTRLNSLLSHELRRLKAGPVEAEWERGVQETRAAVVAQEEIPPLPGDSSPDPSRLDRLREIAQTEPGLAVLAGYRLISAELQKLARQAGLRSGAKIRVTELVNRDVLSPLTGDAILGITQLRAIAAHGLEDVTTERALEYLDLVDAVIDAVAGDERLRNVLTQIGEPVLGPATRPAPREPEVQST